MNQRMKIFYGVGLILLILLAAVFHKPGIPDTETPVGYSAPKSFQQVKLEQERAFQKALADYDKEQAKLAPKPVVVAKVNPVAKIVRKVAFKSKIHKAKSVKSPMSLVKFKPKEGKKLKRVL